MDELKYDPRAKANLAIPFGPKEGFIDSKGQRRYLWFGLPLDQGQQLIKVLFEGLTDLATGQEVDVKGITKSIAAFSPVDVTTLPPTVAAFFGYISNVDFWQMESIHKGQKGALGWPNSSAERTTRTPEFLNDVGDITKMSPERLDYAIGQLISNDNIYAQILGKGYNALLHKADQSSKDRLIGELLSVSPLAKSFIKMTNPNAKFAQVFDEISDNVEAERLMRNYSFEKIFEQYSSGDVNRGEVDRFIRSFKKEPRVEELLKDKFQFAKDMRAAKIPNEGFWRRMRGETVEARAAVYVDRFNKADAFEKLELRKEVDKVKKLDRKSSQFNIFTDSFNNEVKRLQREQRLK